MATKKITYVNKQQYEPLPDIIDEQKFTADNANEIKEVVNDHADKIDLLESQIGVELTFNLPLKKEGNEVSIERDFQDKVNNSISETKTSQLINESLVPVNEKIEKLEQEIKDIDLSQVETNKNDISTLRNDLGDLGNIVNTNTNSINTLKPQVETNKNDIATINQKNQEQDANIQANTSEIANVKLVNTTQTQELESLKEQVANLIEKEKDDINLIGEIVSSKTYNLGDFGFVGDKWYVAIKDSVSGDVSNTTNWKEVGFQQKVNLDNYPTKQEVDSLLAQKVDNTTYSQDKQTLGERLSAIELKNTQQDNAIETKLDKSIYEADKPTFATKDELSKYLYLDNKTLSVNNGNVKRFDIISSSLKTSIVPNQILLSSSDKQMIFNGNLGVVSVKNLRNNLDEPLSYEPLSFNFSYDYNIPHIKWVKEYVSANAGGGSGGEPADYQQVKQQVETNKNNISSINSKIPTFATNDSVDSKINSINIFAGYTMKENTDFTISGKEIRFNGFTIPDGYAFYFNGYFETNNGDYIYPNTAINYNGGNSLFNNANSWNTGEVIPLLFTGNNKLVVKSDKFSSITKVNNLRVYFKRVG